MHPFQKYDDLQLFDLVKEGQRGAYAEIYNRYWAPLYRHALRMLGNEGAAEDTIQDVFVTLWDKALHIELQYSLSTYLYSATRNRILDQWRRQIVQKKYAQRLGELPRAEDCPTDSLVRERQLADIIEKEVAALPENYRQAFELSRSSEMTYREIAQQLGVSEHAVRNNISRALKLLRKRLGDTVVLYMLISNL